LNFGCLHEQKHEKDGAHVSGGEPGGGEPVRDATMMAGAGAGVVAAVAATSVASDASAITGASAGPAAAAAAAAATATGTGEYDHEEGLGSSNRRASDQPAGSLGLTVVGLATLTL
ncbi:hypothetical protein BG004_002730, partial [Podila humilis]